MLDSDRYNSQYLQDWHNLSISGGKQRIFLGNIHGTYMPAYCGLLTRSASAMETSQNKKTTHALAGQIELLAFQFMEDFEKLPQEAN